MKLRKYRILKVMMLAFIVFLASVNGDVYADGGLVKENGKDPGKEIRIVKEEKKDIDIRFPNKLEAKTPPKNKDNNNSEEGNTNKGIRTENSKARATITENVNNANKNYPIYHGIDLSNKDIADMKEALEDKDKKPMTNSEESKYAADARQFISFQTKNGKTFHLIINHDEKTENVLLLTEVSEDDLLNFVDVKEKKEEVVKKVTTEEKPEEKPVKEEKDNTAMYFIVILVGLAFLGAAYYFKVIKKKEDKELENFEEEEEEYYSEATNKEDSEETEELEDDELL